MDSHQAMFLFAKTCETKERIRLFYKMNNGKLIQGVGKGPSPNDFFFNQQVKRIRKGKYEREEAIQNYEKR